MSKIRSLVSTDSNKFDKQNTVEQFLVFCETYGLGKDSLRSHKYALNQFFEQYTEKNIANIPEVKKALTSVLNGKQDAYYNKTLNAIRKFSIIVSTKG
ncbi:hypothetical protein [Pelosinus sp. UFO1]|uniref:hypothetical protein n=1 Tax=Pelosinus sp. UFO1 TaxID=484770 RepID=UPI0004D1565B|nr:hypothetical protein [Pelosinus sp. UFO1]AIF51160.1 hypothetical protein UFO1_1609 [Pelosinus sp. UFO1]